MCQIVNVGEWRKGNGREGKERGGEKGYEIEEREREKGEER